MFLFFVRVAFPEQLMWDDYYPLYKKEMQKGISMNKIAFAFL